jgi:hypothetical protein
MGALSRKTALWPFAILAHNPHVIAQAVYFCATGKRLTRASMSPCTSTQNTQAPWRAHTFPTRMPHRSTRKTLYTTWLTAKGPHACVLMEMVSLLWVRRPCATGTEPTSRAFTDFLHRRARPGRCLRLFLPFKVSCRGAPSFRQRHRFARTGWWPHANRRRWMLPSSQIRQLSSMVCVRSLR